MRAVLLCLVLRFCCGAATAPTPPDIDLNATVSQDVAKPREVVPVLIVVTNKSAVSVSNIRLKLLTPDFEMGHSETGPLKAFATAAIETTIKVLPSASFTAHHLVVLAEYDWGSNASFHSDRTAVINLQVIHAYGDEAKGLPGGSAAIFYLILPIIPAFLSFDLLDGLRKGEGLRLPKFDASYLVPAFLLAILLEYLTVLGNAHHLGIDLSEPTQLVEMLAAATIAGAVVPVAQMVWQRVHAFKESDNLKMYLKKALKQYPSGRADWVSGTGSAQGLAGLLLNQPGTELALGARLQISPVNQSDGALRGCFGSNLSLSNPKLLTKLVAEGHAKLEMVEQIETAGSRWPKPVLTHRMAGFTYEKARAKPIVEYTS